MGKSSTKRKNPNVWKATRRRVARLAEHEVKVGWSEQIKAKLTQDKNGLTTVDIATINVLGAHLANGGEIKPRDPITPVVRGNANTIRGFNSKAVKAANRGEDPVPALEQLAEFLDKEVVKSVRDFNDPPNTQSTADGKGFNNPLVGAGSDGGRLVAEVGAAVVKR